MTVSQIIEAINMKRGSDVHVIPWKTVNGVNPSFIKGAVPILQTIPTSPPNPSAKAMGTPINVITRAPTKHIMVMVTISIQGSRKLKTYTQAYRRASNI
jgi:hypothetical protein